jgi:hypothetical protein
LGSTGLGAALGVDDAPLPDGDDEQAIVITPRQTAKSIFQNVFIGANNTLNSFGETWLGALGTKLTTSSKGVFSRAE